MPIRSTPIADITEGTLRELIAREIREDRTIDFKQDLNFGDSAKLDLLQDVTAMANAAGGVLLYGAIEGKGEDRGLIVDLKGTALPIDELQSNVDNLLRDGIDERIHGVEHRAILLADGTHAYVIRIPASALAPHMVKKKSGRPAFYVRGTTSNDPMTARQVKDMAIRAETARERALQYIEARTERARKRVARPEVTKYGTPIGDQTAALVHFIPLLPRVESLDLADATIKQMVQHQLHPFMYHLTGRLRWALDGLYAETSGSGRQWTMVARSGAIEFGRLQLLFPSSWSGAILDIRWIEEGVLQAAAEIEEHASAILAPPFALSVRLLNVVGQRLGASVGHWEGTDPIQEDDVFIEPEIVSGWGDPLQRTLHRTFDVIWQAWGQEGSPYYNPDGTRKPRL